MKKTLLTLLIIFGCLGSTWAQLNTLIISGTVTDSLSNQPIVGFPIWVIGTDSISGYNYFNIINF